MTRRLIAPPFPEASQPSNSTQTGGPMPCSPIRPPRVSLNWVNRTQPRSNPRSSSLRESFRLRSSSSSLPTPASLFLIAHRPGVGVKARLRLIETHIVARTARPGAADRVAVGPDDATVATDRALGAEQRHGDGAGGAMRRLH